MKQKKHQIWIYVTEGKEGILSRSAIPGVEPRTSIQLALAITHASELDSRVQYDALNSRAVLAIVTE